MGCLAEVVRARRAVGLRSILLSGPGGGAVLSPGEARLLLQAAGAAEFAQRVLWDPQVGGALWQLTIGHEGARPELRAVCLDDGAEQAA
jgi:hypothetical protein